MSVFTVAEQFFQNTQTMAVVARAFNQFFIIIKLLIAFFGSITIFVGAVLAIYRYISYRLNYQDMSVNDVRLDFARSIILGLEFFVAADVIETAIAPDFSSLAILGLLVVIRTLLNYSMEREIQQLSLRK